MLHKLVISYSLFSLDTFPISCYSFCKIKAFGARRVKCPLRTAKVTAVALKQFGHNSPTDWARVLMKTS